MAENNIPNNDPDNYQTPEEAYTKSQQSPAVASTPGKNYIYLGLFAIILISIVYFIFGSKSEKKDDLKDKKVFLAKPPTIDSSQLIVPPLPPAPPSPPIKIDENAGKEDNELEVTPEEKQAAKARMQSQMLIQKSGGLLGGGGGLGSRTDPNAGLSLTEVNDNDPNVGFADSFFNQKDSPFATARKLGDTGRLITQGKIIDAVLETPINTDIPGMIRAIVSRDIYAESGRAILIPKGSRLVGTYNSLVIRGNKRVNVIWSRVIRPDGIDIMIRSPGTDQLGTAGVPGDVDNKYLEIFASAFLVSAINIAVGYGTDQIDPNQGNNTSTKNTDGSTTTNTSATQQAGIKAIDLFGNAGTNLVNGFLNLKPTITIDQGTRVNVFVNRDLVFPPGFASTVQMVQ